jgi:hypothetical protein
LLLLFVNLLLLLLLPLCCKLCCVCAPHGGQAVYENAGLGDLPPAPVPPESAGPAVVSFALSVVGRRFLPPSCLSAGDVLQVHMANRHVTTVSSEPRAQVSNTVRVSPAFVFLGR